MPVLRSTSDVSDKTTDTQRKKRDRKERPYKSDPFSDADSTHEEHRGKRFLDLGQSVIIITEFNIFKTLYEEHRGKRFLDLGQSVIIITEFNIFKTLYEEHRGKRFLRSVRYYYYRI